jgi:Domain of unknown function (DUF5666)
VTASTPSAATPLPASAPAPSASSSAGAATAPAAASAVKPRVGLGALRQAIRRNFRVDVTATGNDGSHGLLYVRGVLDVGQGSVTVRLPDASTATFVVDAGTIVRDNTTSTTFGDLKDGDRAMVFGAKNQDGSYSAKLIRRLREPAAGTAPTASAAP